MKQYLLLLAIITTPLLTLAQNAPGELKGTVLFKTSGGHSQADAGADVIIYLIDSIKSPTNKYEKQHAEDSIINNSFLATIYYDEWAHTPTGKTQRQMVRKLKALDAYPEEKLHELDNQAAGIIRAREQKKCAKTNADNNGSYSVKLNPGYYGIIFRSRHLRSRSRSEAGGNILLDDAVVVPGKATSKNEEML